MKHLKFFLFLFVFLVSIVSVSAIELTNQKLENYGINIEVLDGKVHVSQSFDVVSTSDKPIVPGYAKLTLFEGADPQNIIVSIGGSTKQLDTYELVDGKPVIYYDIWRPLSSGERLSVAVSFDLDDFVKTGILFQEINFEIGQLMIPVDMAKFTLKIPSGKHLTFNAPKYDAKYKLDDGIVYEYNVNPGASINAEFSSVPLPTLPFNGYWIWAIFAMMCLVYFLMQVVGVVKDIKSNKNFERS
ncbi:hypothetical protein JXM83_02580 [Candidatus Woesearchaeota archaeon]|nr:hypothetical protein [Candidatus Woesearchaeota archaeon]